jgi:ABC-2 type transport system ATP-binding protein
LKTKPGVDQTVVFGSALHGCRRERAPLAATLAEIEKEGAQPGHARFRVAPIATGLEDVFIYLMTRAPNHEAHAGGSRP